MTSTAGEVEIVEVEGGVGASISEMKIIDTNIEKCIAELKKSFENLTTNMVLVQSADQVKYKR